MKFPHFSFDAAAQATFIDWSSEMHQVRLPAEDNPIIAQHLAKYDKLFPAIALILHLVDCADTGRRGPISQEAALRAAAWCEFLEAHARRCYGLLADDGLRATQALSDKVASGRLMDGFTARDVRRNQWRYLTTDEAGHAALDWLEDEDWLRAQDLGGKGPGSGRRTRRSGLTQMRGSRRPAVSDWLQQAQDYLSRGAEQTTAKSDERDLTAVMAVPRPEVLSEKNIEELTGALGPACRLPQMDCC